ncbi:MAG: DUF3606 domain-containing protein [Pseudolabrys sp.]|nr:DUF3606 domain-containing protein [Pseudolabrys sp.]
MTHVSRTKPDRHRIDLADDSVARHWTKKLGHSRDQIAAAIAKVGDNCETVRKELGLADARKEAKDEAKAEAKADTRPDALPADGGLKVATAT